MSDPPLAAVKAALSGPLAGWSVGDRVVLARVRHAEYVGRVGTVAKVVKSRGVLKVKLDNPPTKAPSAQIYAALPGNVDREVAPIAGSPPTNEAAHTDAHGYAQTGAFKTQL